MGNFLSMIRAYIDRKTLEQMDVHNVKDVMTKFEGMKGYARVYSVYDGDTCTIVFRYPSLKRYIRQRVRMAHYDTAEIQKRNRVGNAEDVLAKDAKKEFETLVNFIDGSKPNAKKNRYSSRSDIVWYEVIDVDSKWNRPIVMLWNVSKPERSINAIIHERHGINYEGATKSHRWGDDREGKIDISYDCSCRFN